MWREPRTAKYMIRAGLSHMSCEGRPLSNIEMQRLVDSTRRNKSHCRLHGECEHGCSAGNRRIHHVTGQQVCRWTSQQCPRLKLASLLDALKATNIGGANE